MNMNEKEKRELLSSMLKEYRDIIIKATFSKNSSVDDGVSKLKGYLLKLKEAGVYDFNIEGNDQEVLDSVREFTEKYK